MNFKLIVFSGIVTALIGSVVGLAATKLGQDDFHNLKYESPFYQNLQDKYVLVGAGLGFAIGIGQECVRELKNQRDKEVSNQDPW
jgi:hypothetical protein